MSNVTVSKKQSRYKNGKPVGKPYYILKYDWWFYRRNQPKIENILGTETLVNLKRFYTKAAAEQAAMVILLSCK
jgi:hypothetical protein